MALKTKKQMLEIGVTSESLEASKRTSEWRQFTPAGGLVAFSSGVTSGGVKTMQARCTTIVYTAVKKKDRWMWEVR
jgi:hypothetical protein